MSVEKSVDDTAAEAAAEAAGASRSSRSESGSGSDRQFGRAHARAAFNIPGFTSFSTRAQLENLSAAAIQTNAGVAVGNVGSLRRGPAPTTAQVAPAYSMNTTFGGNMEWEKHSSPAF